jgi:hypothetical protein
MHNQSQQLVDIRIKVKEDGKWMSGLYAKSHQEFKMIQQEVQKTE